jgi:hypothetical protein
MLVQNAANNPPNAPTVKQALMFVYNAANCDTIAGPHNTEIIIDARLIFLVLPNNNEKVIHEIIPAI